MENTMIQDGYDEDWNESDDGAADSTTRPRHRRIDQRRCRDIDEESATLETFDERLGTFYRRRGVRPEILSHALESVGQKVGV